MSQHTFDGLDPEINENVRNDSDNKAIQNALDLVQRNFNTKNRRDSWNRSIQNLFEQGFEIREPTGPRKISSKKLFQALWRMASRMKPLDFAIHGNGRPREEEKVVTSGVSTVMTDGRYVSSLRDKGGAFYNLLMYGDGYISVGANPEDGPPIVFNPISNTNIYVDEFAIGIRDKGWGRNATKMMAVFSYSWAEFVAMFPEMKKVAGLGKIPRELDSQRELEREKRFGRFELEDIVEVAYAYDINARNYCVFAGSETTKILELKGDDYPFVMNGEPYIPILHYLCFPSSEGFYNYGIGNMLYDLAIISRRMLNMEIGHIEDNTYPIELVNVPQGEAGKFFNKLALADEMRGAGKKGFVAMEYDPTNPNANTVQSQTLLTQNLFNEWQAVFDRLDNEIKRMGIPLDEIDRGPGVTATQILAEEENANAFIKQIMEYNASESKFAVDLTINFIDEFVNKNDKTPLRMSTTLDFPEGEVRADGLTLGMVADELRKHDYWTRVNARTGAIPSNILRSAQITRGLSLAAPGSKAQIKLISEFASIHDLDLSGEDFLPQVETPVISQERLEQAAEPEAAGTERLTFSPQREEQVPAL